MCSFYLFIILLCAVSSVRSASVSVEGSNEAVDDSVNEVDVGENAVDFIRLSEARRFKGNFAVDSHKREILVFAGEEIVEHSHIQALFEKYFNGGSPNLFNFTGNGVAHYKDLGNATAQLEIYAKEPGLFYFEYSNRQHAKDATHRWLVRSIPSYTLKRGSPFEFDLGLARIDVSGRVRIDNLEDVGVYVHPDRRTLFLRGVARNIENGTLLDIQMGKGNIVKSKLQIRLLIEEPRESVQLWIEDSNDRQSLKECVAALYGKRAEDLLGVSFQQLENGTAVFKARISEVDTCSIQRAIARQVHDCGKLIGLRLTCRMGEDYEEFRAKTSSTLKPNPTSTSANPSDIETTTVPSSPTERPVSSTSEFPKSRLTTESDQTTPKTDQFGPDTDLEHSSTAAPGPSSTARPSSSSTSTTTTAQSPVLMTEGSTTPESSGKAVTTEHHRDSSAGWGSYSSFLNHIQFYAIVWLGIFIILFLLICFLSR